MKILKAIFLIIGILFLTLVAIGIFKRDFTSQATIDINAPVDQTFAIYNNPFLLNRWLTDFKSMENISGKLNQVGSQWKLTFNNQNGDDVIVNETITAFVQDKRITFDYDNIWLTGHNETVFESLSANKTKITLTQEYSGKGIIQNAMFFLMSSHVDNLNQQNLEQLKSLIEQSRAEDFE